jgi:hypothetical protein
LALEFCSGNGYVWWEFWSSEMFQRCVAAFLVPDVSKDPSSVIFKGQAD